MPAGLVSAADGCGGAVGSRPSRPATTGRVDGLTAKENLPPSESYVLDRESAKYWTTLPWPMTGDVAVMNSLLTSRDQPVGAVPTMVEWYAGSAVARCTSR